VTQAGKYQAIFRMKTDKATFGAVIEAELRSPFEKKDVSD